MKLKEFWSRNNLDEMQEQKLLKLESRPLPDRDFEFLFYLDLETSVYSDEFARLMCEIGDICEEFKYLGSYSEVV